MSDLSKYLGNKIVRWLAGQDMPSAPTSIYIGLFDGDPKSGGSEVTTTIRPSGRIAVPFETTPAAGVDNDITTDDDADFGNSAGNASVSHVGIFDAAASGNLLAAKSVGSFSVDTGELVRIPAGDLTFTIGD